MSDLEDAPFTDFIDWGDDYDEYTLSFPPQDEETRYGSPEYPLAGVYPQGTSSMAHLDWPCSGTDLGLLPGGMPVPPLFQQAGGPSIGRATSIPQELEATSHHGITDVSEAYICSQPVPHSFSGDSGRSEVAAKASSATHRGQLHRDRRRWLIQSLTENHRVLFQGRGGLHTVARKTIPMTTFINADEIARACSQDCAEREYFAVIRQLADDGKGYTVCKMSQAERDGMSQSSGNLSNFYPLGDVLTKLRKSTREPAYAEKSRSRASLLLRGSLPLVSTAGTLSVKETSRTAGMAVKDRPFIHDQKKRAPLATLQDLGTYYCGVGSFSIYQSTLSILNEAVTQAQCGSALDQVVLLSPTAHPPKPSLTLVSRSDIQRGCLPPAAPSNTSVRLLRDCIELRWKRSRVQSTPYQTDDESVARVHGNAPYVSDIGTSAMTQKSDDSRALTVEAQDI